MNYVKKICLVLIMLAANFSYANESSRDYNPDATCGDFLRQFDHHAPNYFEYYDCQEEDSYLRPISAYYKVEGKYAKQAEQYLIDKTGIGKLVKVCCYWESEKGRWGYFTHPKDNTSYTVIFSSEEAISEDWQDLTFYVMIRVYRESV